MTLTEAQNLIMGKKSVLRTKVSNFSRLSHRRAFRCQPVDHYAAILEHLRQGTAKVRDVLGPQVSITDKEIEDSLWHNYYDVDKTVDYLISTIW